MRRRRSLLVGLALAVALLGALAAFLSRDDWNWAKRPVEWIASRTSGRSVTIQGDLEVDLGRRTDVVANRVLVGNPEWAAIPELASSGRLAFRVRTLPLLFGRLELERLEADDTRLLLERREDGSGNWTFPRRGKGQPLAIPAVIRLTGFDVALSDPKRPRGFRLHVDELESRRQGAVHLLSGDGIYQDERFILKAALLGLPRKGGGATPMALELRVGETVASARGELGDGETPDLVRARLEARGPTLDDFWRLAGVPFPESPPFEIEAGFAFREGEVRLRPMRGELGKSDVAGALVVRLPRGGRMAIEADLRSRSVDLDDVEGFWGRRPKHEESAPAPAKTAGGADSVFPDLPFSFPKLRAADARLKYRAGRIQGKSILDHVHVDATLQNGVLELAPLSLGMSAGELATRARLDARGKTTGLAAEVVLQGIELAELLRRMGIEERGAGDLGGRADFTARGNSLHELARSADGEVGVVLAEGSLSDPLLELLALHLGDYIFAKLDKDDDGVPIRCLVGLFHGEDGRLESRRLLLDTRHVRIEGEGSIDLGRERLDLELKQHSKDFAIGALRTPILISGPFTSRKATLKPGPLAARGGAAIALGAAIHPLAALLALVDPGKDDKPNACAQALAEVAPIAKGVGERRASAPARRAAKERRDPGEGSR